MSDRRYTDRAQKLLKKASQEAKRFNHEYIGPEHLLLGLLSVDCCAAELLRKLNVDPAAVRRRVEETLVAEPDVVSLGNLPWTPRARKVEEHALQEARANGQPFAGTEHILLGLVREHESLTCKILMDAGVTVQAVRDTLGSRRVILQKCKEDMYVLDVRDGADATELAEVITGLQAGRRIKTIVVILEDEKD